MAKKKTDKSITTSTGEEGVVEFVNSTESPVFSGPSFDTVPEGKTMVNSDALAKMLERMDKLEAETKELKAENEALADKSRLARYRQKTAGKMGKTVRLGTWQGKVITGWDALNKNMCEKNPAGVYVEQLERTLHLEDGTIVTMPYVESVRHIESIEATVTGETTTDEEIDHDGNLKVLLDVVDENGNKWTIDNRFINL